MLGGLRGCGDEVVEIEEDKESRQQFWINSCAKHPVTRDIVAVAMAPLHKLPCRAHDADQQHEGVVSCLVRRWKHQSARVLTLQKPDDKMR